MSEGTKCDTTDQGTLRPQAKPILKPGTEFKPVKLSHKDFEINLPSSASPNDPITLFELYYTPQIIDQIVGFTNSYRREPKSPNTPHSRALQWVPTTPSEIYRYIAIRIYTTIHPEPEITDYWSQKNSDPTHKIVFDMPKDRFLELHMRFRVGPPGTQDIYEKVHFPPLSS